MDYIPTIHKNDINKPLMTLWSNEKGQQDWLYNHIKIATNKSQIIKETIVNRTTKYMTLLGKFIHKQQLTIEDINKGKYLLIIADINNLIDYKWNKNIIGKLDQEFNIIESYDFPNPSGTNDFVWNEVLYTYTIYGNTQQPLSSTINIEDIKYKVTRDLQQEKQRQQVDFIPWESDNSAFDKMNKILDKIMDLTIEVRKNKAESDQARKEINEKIKITNNQVFSLQEKQLELKVRTEIDDIKDKQEKSIFENQINLMKELESIKGSLSLSEKQLMERNQQQLNTYIQQQIEGQKVGSKIK